MCSMSLVLIAGSNHHDITYAAAHVAKLLRLSQNLAPLASVNLDSLETHCL